MALLLLILVVLVSVLLGLVVLIQNPKGGGLSGSIAGFSNQFMGVKQTTDVLEKGTWIFAGIIAVLCLTSSLFMKGGSADSEFIKNINTNQQTTAPSSLPLQPAQQGAPQSLPSQDSSK